MQAWIWQHSRDLNLLINGLMLLVWVAYLQVFLRTYRRYSRPFILINRGAGSDLRGRCLVSNMSGEAIYVESIIATLRMDGQEWSCAVTDLEDLETEQIRADPKQGTRQGPLRSGDYFDAGSFQSLVERTLREGDCPQDLRRDLPRSGGMMRVEILANHGAAELPIAARRNFDLIPREGGTLSLHPHRIGTRQITSKRERKKILAAMDGYL